MVKVKLNGHLDAKTVVITFKEIFNTSSVYSGVIVIDLNNISSIKPSGISMVLYICKWIQDKGQEIKFKYESCDSQVLQFLEQSMFFEIVLGGSSYEKDSLLNSNLLVRNLSISSIYEWIEETFSVWISKELSCEINQLDDLKILLLELFNNTRDHSEKENCYTYFQNCHSENIIDISISDIGIGIPANVRKKEPDLKNDIECIKIALERGFTTKTNPSNRGEGLYILRKYITSDKIGILTIISGSGYYKLYPSGEYEHETLNCCFPGTLINIEINTQNIMNILTDIEEKGMNLEW